MTCRAAYLIAMVCVFVAGCGGDNGGQETAADPANGDDAEGGTALVGPPLPESVDESGAPAFSNAQRIAFVGATVVTLADAGVLHDTTVLVDNGRITEIVPDAQFVAAPDTEIIDASNRWLLPGLVDSHVHLVSGTGAENDLLLYLAAGVTAVRVMWGQMPFLAWRDDIAAGTLEGPHLHVASPGLEGAGAFWPGSVVVTSESAARDAVNAQHAAGFDAIKVYNRLDIQPFLAITDEAERLGIPVVGHVPFAVGADLALSDAGMRSIEHFSRYASEVTVNSNWDSALDESKALAVAEKLRLAGTWSVPTLVVQLRTADQVDDLEAHPAIGWLSVNMLSFIRSSSTQPPIGNPDPGSRLQLIRLLHENGAPLAVGTDAGLRYVLPGFSIHEELALFVDAGFSPEEAIRAATVSAWNLLGQPHEGGTIETGKRADFLLLAADPLDDIENLNKRVGVMANGRWYAQSELMQRIGAESP